VNKILILGRGFIGTHLNNFLNDKNHNVFFASQDIIDYKSDYKLAKFIRDNNFYVVINCSGYTGVPNVDACELNKDLCWLYNVVAPNTIDKVCSDYNIKCVHISSGCIYSGYDTEYSEIDIPNFGLYSNVSSFYSKCKHAFETIFNKNHSAIFRIRMPFTNTKENKNYLYKILKYDNLISFKNSFTNVYDLCLFTEKFITEFYSPGIFNVVNPGPMDAKEVVDIFKKHNKVNPNWNFVDISDLNIIAGRSNCVLSTNKIKTMGLELPGSFKSVEDCIKVL
jgi:dTDP-4-dehydrorhamnose reductase